MTRLNTVMSLSLIFILTSASLTQSGDSPIGIFGYFQNSFQHWTTFEDRKEQNSFSVQQLNLFFQKDLSRDWTAFINFEFLNSFSSIRQWGAANLEEAWVKYRANEKFNLKLGLQIPIFNNLNEIKNRTPLLPYIVRPLVYETSFSEFIIIEEFVPDRAFLQVYGFLPKGETKCDYAFYLGNSSNMNDNREKGQTGIDTTTTFLAGGRLGFRYRELKLGLSATHEKKNGIRTLDFISLADSLGREPSELMGLPKTRLGVDMSYKFTNFIFESEFVTVNIDEGIPELELDLDFYYATLGYHLTEQLFAYGSYWVVDVHSALLATGDEKVEDEAIQTLNIGASYDLNDRIRFKGQFARVKADEELHLLSHDDVIKEEDKFSVYAVAVSVFF
ncbi:MAG: hypothetical protein JSV84_05530 [Gemmatimonadota bacterium]|nr:MAG: hypothetical protein JSV84_05530 [Gemmatimonadota bacterium]